MVAELPQILPSGLLVLANVAGLPPASEHTGPTRSYDRRSSRDSCA